MQRRERIFLLAGALLVASALVYFYWQKNQPPEYTAPLLPARFSFSKEIPKSFPEKYLPAKNQIQEVIYGARVQDDQSVSMEVANSLPKLKAHYEKLLLDEGWSLEEISQEELNRIGPHAWRFRATSANNKIIVITIDDLGNDRSQVSILYSNSP